MLACFIYRNLGSEFRCHRAEHTSAVDNSRARFFLDDSGRTLRTERTVFDLADIFVKAYGPVRMVAVQT